ncbi:hypothetical protein EV688_101436 [Chromatocurvus halotolerans]|uniref:Uncharacterized protein n=1 Tax=Chromatocurvus halotolerans TaxID=1132028 RepID=A0A4R2L7G8_9GAMM|nr:hypothetical protein EV688_101436 [Chromatocurvus halotolerans]
MFYFVDDTATRDPWNKGKLIDQKKPLKMKEVWTIRIRLQIADDVRGLALFNLAIDSKLRACDLVKPKVADVTHGIHAMSRATVMQQKTHQRVQFEITKTPVSRWPTRLNRRSSDPQTTCFRAGYEVRYTFLRGSTTGRLRLRGSSLRLLFCGSRSDGTPMEKSRSSSLSESKVNRKRPAKKIDMAMATSQSPSRNSCTRL